MRKPAKQTAKAHSRRLERVVKWLACKICGHRWDEDALMYVAMAYCKRCGYEQPCGPTEPWTLANWIWWRRHRLRIWWRGIREKVRVWMRPHDDDVPF